MFFKELYKKKNTKNLEDCLSCSYLTFQFLARWLFGRKTSNTFYFNELNFVVGIFSCNASCFGVSGFRSSSRNAQPPLVPTCYPLLTLRKASGENCTTTSALARLQRPSPQTSLTLGSSSTLSRLVSRHSPPKYGCQATVPGFF